MYRTGKGLFEGTHIDLDDKKVYNPNDLKSLHRVELYTIVEEDMTEGKSRDKTRSLANTVEAQLLKIMYGEESMTRELKEEGGRVGHKRKKCSGLYD